MALPHISMRQLLEAGVHFGHTTRRWNPKMRDYIFGQRNGVHILDLEQTQPLLGQAAQFVSGVVGDGGRVLFVGTKRQASEKIAEAASRCGQYYVNHRWLGGMLTNWKTISNSIKRLRVLEDQLSQEDIGLTKKELLNRTRERDKLERALGGIKEMGGLPDVLVVIDTNKEHLAVAEAGNLNIPVVGVLDSNSDPAGVTYPIPGNDDALRAISLYCDVMAEAVLDGIQHELIASGSDVGEAEEAPTEALPEEPAKAAASAASEAAPAEAPAEAAAAEEAPAEAPSETPAEGEAVTDATPEAASEEAPAEAASAEAEAPAENAATEEAAAEEPAKAEDDEKKASS